MKNLELTEVARHDLLEERVVVGIPPDVAHIVDTDPYAKERIVGVPRRIVGLARDAAAELGNLVDEAEHRRLVGRHDGGVGRGAAVGKVVRQRRRRVELGDEEADPVQPAAGRPPGQRRVAERVARRRLGARDVETGLGVRVAESDKVLGRSVTSPDRFRASWPGHCEESQRCRRQEATHVDELKPFCSS
ncbi:hypothetical protein VTG60DRAFT_5974 [Thermothelomyces hinnuleus]